MRETHALADYICQIDDTALTAEQLRNIRYKLLDWTGCVLGAAKHETTKKLERVFRAEAGMGSSSVLYSKNTYPLLTAAFLSGAQSHILECDDVHKRAITHPGVVAVAASLAAAESCGKTFEDFALGVIAGYEVMIRIGNALNPSHYQYWHTTGTCGTYAAAAAAGKVWGFDTQQLECAFGHAATMASGLTCVFGTDTKIITVGNAVRNGIMAAQLAKQGLSSCPDALERPFGYAQATSEKPRLNALTEQAPYYMIDTACYKLYASCGHTHSSLDALFSIRRRENFQADDVERILVKAYTKAAELTGTFKAETEAEAKFSIPYCLAAGIICGTVSVEQFRPEMRNNESLRQLAQKITVEADCALDRDYPIKRPEAVTVRLKDGREFYELVELPEGKPECSVIEEKFSSLASISISHREAEEVKKTILRVDRDSSIGELIKNLKGNIHYGQFND